MSGVEAIAVLGVISSILTLIDSTKKVYDAAKNAEGLPAVFREIANRLSIVRDILVSVKQYIESGVVGEDSCTAVRDLVLACQRKTNQLNELFTKAVPKDGVSSLKRLFSAVSTVAKRNEVETLMREILVDVQLLACERGLKLATMDQRQRIEGAISEVSDISSRLSADESRQVDLSVDTIVPGIKALYNASHSVIEQPATNPRDISIDINNACLAALFQTDPRDDRAKLVRTKGSRVDGTCEWILSHEVYRSWLSSEDSETQLLWISGGPGKGKTMLSIFLAEELENLTDFPPSTVFLQYFCADKDEKRRTATSIIRGLIFQLLQLHSELIRHLLPRYILEKDSLFLDIDALWWIFENMLRDPLLENVYCILDGLDECEELSLEAFLKSIIRSFQLASKAKSIRNFRLIIASRELPDIIPELLSYYPRIDLDANASETVNSDIDQFINTKIALLSRFKRYPKRLQEHLRQVFRDRAGETFLWIGIVAQELEKYKATEVEAVLRSFPAGLQELYARMLLQITQERREIAAKLLRWVALAVRPLYLAELNAAIGEESEHSSVFTGWQDRIRDRVSYCGYLLTTSKESEVDFIHQSAKDYLLRDATDSDPRLEFFRVQKEAGELEVATKCFDSLHNSPLQDGKIKLEGEPSPLRQWKSVPEYPLLSYATLHWVEHARFVSYTADIFHVSNLFYHRKSTLRDNWLQTYRSVYQHLQFPYQLTPFQFASAFGLLPLAETLLEDLISFLNETDRTQIRTGLNWALRRGHTSLVKLYLTRIPEVDVKTVTKAGDTIFHLAAKLNSSSLLPLLMNKGANLESQNPIEETALHIAAKFNRLPILRTLLETGANIEARQYAKYTPLHVAAIRGHYDAVRLLLKHRPPPDIEARTDLGYTPLYLAALKDHQAILTLLLDHGASVQSVNNLGETALHAAARNGNKDIVCALLKSKASLEAETTAGDTPFAYATEHGHESVAELLLAE